MVHSEEPFEINAREVFHDADGDTLTFTVRSSDSRIAEFEVKGHMVTVKPYGMGSAIITITADDGNGGTAEESFKFGLYSFITELRHEVSTDFINLYWDPFWDSEDEGLNYHIYVDDKLIGTTDSTNMWISDLRPGTEYRLRVVAVNDAEEIVAFADYSVKTYPIELWL